MAQKHSSPLIGSLPKIGIRPVIDGRRRGVRESLESQVMNMAKTAAKFLSANLRYPNGKPVECVIADTCIGGVAEAAACAEKFARAGRRRVAHRHALLVLRQRNDGHGPAHAQGRLGLQRHRAARRGLSGRRARRPQPERPARLRHLRPRRAGRRRLEHPRGRAAKSCCASPGPAWPSASCAASPTFRWAASRWASPARSWTRHSSRTTWACASSAWT